MIRKLIFSLFLFLVSFSKNLQAQSKLDKLLPVRAFAIGAPQPYFVDSFVAFIHHDLSAMHVNTLLLRVDYNYQFTSHPELRDSIALSNEDVKKIVLACRENHIQLIPQINLFGHQSWAGRTTNLLRVYPEFDETPKVKMPDVYQWPNADNLYCKSYCPLHPAIHKVLFALIDEICDAFEATAFHAGMDEVFYIGDSTCPRCNNKDKAKLFADEVILIRNHLAASKRQLWIWGDRLLDGVSTGLGIWEASENNTYHAVDMIPKDVVVCDWHYDTQGKTASYFAEKGFNVISCVWQNPVLAIAQLNDMVKWRKASDKQTRSKFRGMMQTVWTSTPSFVRGYYESANDNPSNEQTAWNAFRQMFTTMNSLN